MPNYDQLINKPGKIGINYVFKANLWKCLADLHFFRTCNVLNLQLKILYYLFV